MNWGNKIVVILTVFVLFILGMSLVMFMSPQDDFDHDYYEKGLNFDKDYNREKQVTIDHAEPQIQVNNGQILISFTRPALGKIKFQRPSSTVPDKLYTVNGQQLVIPADMPHGKWEMEFEWQSDGKAYLYQKSLYLK
jgi:hypothetical protein